MAEDGREAYEAFVSALGGATVEGWPLPAWEEVSMEGQLAWQAAADAVAYAVAVRVAQELLAQQGAPHG